MKELITMFIKIPWMSPMGLDRCQIIKYSGLSNGSYSDLSSYR